MSLLVFQHHATKGPAVLGTILQSYGHRLRTVALYDNEPLPADLDDVDGIISLGGPMNVDQADQFPWIEQEMAYIRNAIDADLPVVGICLGAQLLATALGGEVGPMQQPEAGWHGVRLAFPGTIDPVHAGIAWDSMQFHLHGQEVKSLPPGGVPLSGSRLCRTQAFKVNLKAYGFQYHFEWDMHDIEQACLGEFGQSVGLSVDQIKQQAREHYDGYRRRGDRLCHTLANLLFQIDKR